MNEQTNNRKTVRLGDLFTEEQIKKAVEIVHNFRRTGRSLNDILVERVVREAMPRINDVTGQENDERYWAYVLEAALTQEFNVP